MDAFIAIHRTYLRPDGADKANVEPLKLMLGPTTGGAVRFVKPTSIIAIAEGIEMALSVAQACRKLAAWAALCASGLRAIWLPDVLGEAGISK
jgi:hypothetical protein